MSVRLFYLFILIKHMLIEKNSPYNQWISIKVNQLGLLNHFVLDALTI